MKYLQDSQSPNMNDQAFAPLQHQSLSDDQSVSPLQHIRQSSDLKPPETLRNGRKDADVFELLRRRHPSGLDDVPDLISIDDDDEPVPDLEDLPQNPEDRDFEATLLHYVNRMAGYNELPLMAGYSNMPFGVAEPAASRVNEAALSSEVDATTRDASRQQVPPNHGWRIPRPSIVSPSPNAAAVTAASAAAMTAASAAAVSAAAALSVSR